MSTPDLPTAATESDRRESAAWQRGYDYGRGISTPEPGDVKATMRYVEAQPDSGPYRPAMPAHWIIELPDADTAALRAENVRLNNEINGAHYHWREQYDALKVRADAAEARLARVTALDAEASTFGAEEFGEFKRRLRRALVADDEQAAEACPTCSGPDRRETTGMVCQTCGRDFAPEPLVDEVAAVGAAAYDEAMHDPRIPHVWRHVARAVVSVPGVGGAA